MGIPNDESVRHAAHTEFPSEARFSRSARRAPKSNLSLAIAGSPNLGEDARSDTNRSACRPRRLSRCLAFGSSLLGRTARRDANALIWVSADVPNMAFDSTMRVTVSYHAGNDTCQDGLYGPTNGRCGGKSSNDCLQIVVAREIRRFERQVKSVSKILDK